MWLDLTKLFPFFVKNTYLRQFYEKKITSPIHYFDLESCFRCNRYILGHIRVK